MSHSTRALILFVCSTLVVYGQSNNFDRVRYNGGSVDSKVDPKEWHNHLTVTSDKITLALKDGKVLDIPPKSVTNLSYGQEAHRRVGTMVALAIIVSPVALFGLLHKTRLHFIGIQYNTPDGKSAGILLQGDKDNYRAILVALQGVTNVPVSVAEKDREFIPVGVKADVTKSADDRTEAKAGTDGKTEAGTPSEAAKGTINLTSTPTGADVLVDGKFVGNAPAALKVSAGNHTITVKSAGFKDWTRDLTIEAGSEVQLNATLDKN